MSSTGALLAVYMDGYMSPISSGKHYVKQSPVTSYMQPQWHLAAVHDPLYGFSHNLKRGSLLFLSTIHARLDFVTCHLDVSAS